MAKAGGARCGASTESESSAPCPSRATTSLIRMPSASSMRLVSPPDPLLSMMRSACAGTREPGQCSAASTALSSPIVRTSSRPAQMLTVSSRPVGVVTGTS